MSQLLRNFQATFRKHFWRAPLTAEEAVELARAAQAWCSEYERQPTADRLGLVYRGLELLRSVLAELDSRTSPTAWALTQHGLGNALRILPGEDRQRNLEDAAVCFEAALRVFRRDSYPAQWAATMTNLGVVWSTLGGLEGGSAGIRTLHRAIAYFDAALTVRSESATPVPWSLTQNNLGNAWLRLAEEGEPDAAVRAIEAYESALQVRTRETAPLQWARTVWSLAGAYLHLPENLRSPQLPKAIEAANDALAVLTPESNPSDWSGAHLTLGNAYFLLAAGDRNDNLNQAITHFETALPLLNGVASNASRLRCQLVLADSLVELQKGDRQRNLARAIPLYRDWLTNAPSESAQRPAVLEALAVTYRASGELDLAASSYEQALNLMPSDTKVWAQLQWKLGNVLHEIGTWDRPKDPRRSIGCYEAALRVYSRSEDREEQARLYIDMGVSYAALPGPSQADGTRRAIECYETALHLSDKAHDPKTWATAQFNLGNALSRLHDGKPETLRNALRHLEAASTIDTERDNPGAWASVQNSLGSVYRQLDDLKAAAKCLESALRVLSEKETPYKWATSQAILGGIYEQSAGREGTPALRKAGICYENSLRVTTKEGNPIDWARVTSGLGVVRSKLAASSDDARLAIGIGESALSALRHDEHPRDWAICKDNLGRSFLYLRTGNREENLQAALSHFASALDVLDPADYPVDWAATQVDNGIAYAQLGSIPPEHNLGQALKCYTSALAVYTKRDFPREWAATQVNIGALHLHLSDLGIPGAASEAVRSLEAALQVISRESNPTLWAQTNIDLGTALRSQEPERSLKCYQAAIEALGPADQPQLLSQAQHLLGESYATRSSKANDQQRAIECFEHELEMLTPDSNPSEYLRAATGLARTYYKNRQWSLALTQYLAAAAAIERLRMESADEATHVQVLRESSDVFDLGMLSAVQAGQYERALEFSQHAKGRNLAKQLRRAEYKPRSVATEEWDRYARVVQELAAKHRITVSQVLDQTAAATYQEDMQHLSRLREEAAVLERRFAECDPEYALIDRPLDSQRLASLARALDAVIVDFRVSTKGSYAFLAGPDGIFNADNGVRLELVIERNSIDWPGFSGVMSVEDIASGRADSLVRDSYQLIMAPIRKRLRDRYPTAKRLIIMPSRVLSLLPLQAARIDSEDGSGYFLDEYEIAWAPNGAILERCMARGLKPPTIPRRLLAVQNPDGSLPFADWEVEEIAKLFPQGSGQTFFGATATRAVVEQNCTHSTEALFCCHALFDAAAPEKSHLRLANGPLTRRDLLQLDFRNTSLVVMSACTSGVVDLQTLDVDEHFGLATACLVAGAKTVVASLWEVNDASTALLMQRFHHNLYVDGMETARALQEAQVWLRDMDAEQAFEILEARQRDCEDEQDAADAAMALLEISDRGPKPFSHPYWWAAFQCIGVGWTPTRH